jgi:uncharacterized LabA/DUF88 family protein
MVLINSPLKFTREAINVKNTKVRTTIQGAKRVGVFLDFSNISAGALQVRQARINYYQLLLEATSGRQLISATAYCVRGEEEDITGFYEQLKIFGYRIRSKVAKVYPNGQRKGNWDVGMAVDAIIMAPKLDVVVIVSGDGDFVDLIEPLHSHGCSVEVFAFRQNTSNDLRDASDRYVDLDNDIFIMPWY